MKQLRQKTSLNPNNKYNKSLYGFKFYQAQLLTSNNNY